MFYLLVLSNPIFNFTVHFDNFITFDDGWLESTAETLVFQLF